VPTQEEQYGRNLEDTEEKETPNFQPETSGELESNTCTWDVL
jgi:hypothetical protein